MVLPVLVLTEGAAVARRVATAARLVGLASTVPATLKKKQKINIVMLLYFVRYLISLAKIDNHKLSDQFY